jgi:hypothetical protein
MPGDAVRLDDLALRLARDKDECFARKRCDLRDVVGVRRTVGAPDG